MDSSQRIDEAHSIGARLADRALAMREEALSQRAQALASAPGDHSVLETPASFGTESLAAAGSRGTLVAEGDSWFDYPFNDVLKSLEDDHGYDIESVAHRGDTIEEMAYSGGQLQDFLRCIEKALRHQVAPKAVLLSGGGNDVAGDEFAVLLNHANSPNPGLSDAIVDSLINDRLAAAYVTILTSVTHASKAKLGAPLPILLHGYAHAVPDGRAVFGLSFLPGPWLQPGFRRKGFGDLNANLAVVANLIDRFNTMLEEVTNLPAFDHVHYLDLRPVLTNRLDDGPKNRPAYRDDWSNELHPTGSGFERVAGVFAEALDQL